MNPAEQPNRLGTPGKTGTKTSGCSYGGERDSRPATIATETESKPFSGLVDRIQPRESLGEGGLLVPSVINTINNQSTAGRGAWRCARTGFNFRPHESPAVAPFSSQAPNGSARGKGKQSIGGRGAWRCSRTVFDNAPMNHPLWTPFRLKDTYGATALATVATTLTRQAHPSSGMSNNRPCKMMITAWKHSPVWPLPDFTMNLLPGTTTSTAVGIGG